MDPNGPFANVCFDPSGPFETSVSIITDLSQMPAEAVAGNVVEPVPRYSYRYTEVLNVGAVFLFNDFIRCLKLVNDCLCVFDEF